MTTDIPDDARFVEIEHKYVVDDRFDVAGFLDRARALGPAEFKERSTRDTYWTTAIEGVIYRHRVDLDLQQFTVKSYGADNRTRLEVNLRLPDRHTPSGDQVDAARAFVQHLGVRREVGIDKQSHIFLYDDCEVVHYVATCGERTVRCVEVEAVGVAQEADGLAIIERYEAALGITGMEREVRTLLDLLIG